MCSQRRDDQFERSVVAAYPCLLRRAQSLTRDRAAAMDLVQDTVEKGLRCREGFREGDSPNRWLATILVRIFIDRYRQSRVASQRARQWEVVNAQVEEQPPPQWEAFSIEDVRRVLRFLSPPLRTVYLLFSCERLSYAEISRRLSLPAGTVATRVFRARQRLRELLLSSRPQPLSRRTLPAETAGLDEDGHLSPFPREDARGAA